MDIATLLENHRRHMLTIVSEQEYDNEDELAASRFAVMAAHDRATTKSLLDIYRTANSQQPVGQAALAATADPAAAPKSRYIKPGSKRAKDRAAKAQVTRRENLARKAGTQAGFQGTSPINDPDAPKIELSPREVTSLRPARTVPDGMGGQMPAPQPPPQGGESGGAA